MNFMKDLNTVSEKLISLAIESGATRASVIDASLIKTDKIFREMCAANSCGMYGKCWTCPPDVGEISELMEKLSHYTYALVYQTVSPLEDSFDFESMVLAKKNFRSLSLSLRPKIDAELSQKTLHLGAGGCGVCEVCAKRDGKPCRFPDLAMASLEAYGVNVSELAKSAGMKYINGVNTVTYFGAVLFDL
jgi:predicted metal-binding protein